MFRSLLVIILTMNFLIDVIATEQDSNEEFKTIIATGAKDTTTVNACLEMGIRLMQVSQDSADVYFRKGLEYASGLECYDATAQLHRFVGIVWIGRDNFDSARVEFAKSLRNYQLAEDPFGESRLILNLATVDHLTGHFESSARQFADGLLLAERIEYDYIIPQFHNNMGNMYFDLGDLELGEKYYLLAEESVAKAGRRDMIPNVKLSLAAIAEGR